MQAHEDRQSTAATSLSAQEGLAPLLKRLFFLHSSKPMVDHITIYAMHAFCMHAGSREPQHRSSQPVSTRGPGPTTEAAVHLALQQAHGAGCLLGSHAAAWRYWLAAHM